MQRVNIAGYGWFDCLKIASKASKQFRYLSFSLFQIAEIWTLKFHVQIRTSIQILSEKKLLLIQPIIKYAVSQPSCD